jgi:ribosomal protein L9
MNLRTYYQKVKDIEQTLVEPFVVLESQETPDGGRKGVLTEVPKPLAARMIADGRAHPASEEAAKEFQEKNTQAKRQSDQEAAANRMQVTLVPTGEFRRATRKE